MHPPPADERPGRKQSCRRQPREGNRQSGAARKRAARQTRRERSQRASPAPHLVHHLGAFLGRWRMIHGLGEGGRVHVGAKRGAHHRTCRRSDDDVGRSGVPARSLCQTLEDAGVPHPSGSAAGAEDESDPMLRACGHAASVGLRETSRCGAAFWVASLGRRGTCGTLVGVIDGLAVPAVLADMVNTLMTTQGGSGRCRRYDAQMEYRIDARLAPPRLLGTVDRTSHARRSGSRDRPLASCLSRSWGTSSGPPSRRP